MTPHLKPPHLRTTTAAYLRRTARVVCDPAKAHLGVSVPEMRAPVPTLRILFGALYCSPEV